MNKKPQLKKLSCGFLFSLSSEIKTLINLIFQCRAENEVAFFVCDAVIDLHSHNYGNYEQENRAENERV
ncbi:hypothetical protein [Salegentibacter holothuriorum]|uniref:hypothetical protein n=1 Tax=Salegentibacter holothuriorum TaxID=241145 RepID=UPI0009A8251A|nr:hypothetical protein [Salegentibacter holothuriorum]